MRTSLSAAGAGAVALVTVLTGCSGPPASSAAPAPAGPTARTCQQVTGGAPWHGLLRVRGDRGTLDAYDDYFSPSCLVVPAGRSVTLVLTDRGHLPHTLMAPPLGVDVSVDAGQTAFVSLPPVRAPSRLICGLHEDEHMVMAIVPAPQGPGDV
jgi:hypothetical protein